MVRISSVGRNSGASYELYVAAMDDDLNRANIIPIEEYGAAADWDGLKFDENGDVL